MSKDFVAIIRQESDRAQSWEEVFGSLEIPLRSPIPEWAGAPGIEKALFYQLDISLLNEAQRARLIAYIAKKFQVTESEVASTVDEVGCPILAADITLTVFNPQRWLS